MIEDYKKANEVLGEAIDIITAPTKAQEWLCSDKVTKFCEDARKEREDDEKK